jgi:hypothetical protein
MPFIFEPDELEDSDHPQGKTFPAVICPKSDCPNDTIYNRTEMGTCPQCHTALQEEDLWREDDYQALWELMA